MNHFFTKMGIVSLFALLGTTSCFPFFFKIHQAHSYESEQNLLMEDDKMIYDDTRFSEFANLKVEEQRNRNELILAESIQSCKLLKKDLTVISHPKFEMLTPTGM